MKVFLDTNVLVSAFTTRGQTVVPLPEKPVAVTVRDADDVQVLASAQAAGVDVLVSGDGDLLDLAASESLRILNPRRMWELLREEEPTP